MTVGTGEDIAPVTADKDRVVCDTVANDATGCGGLIRPLATTPAAPAPHQMVTVRFDNNMDNMSESMVYIWVDNHTTFKGDSGVRAGRELDSMVYCEGAAAAKPMRVSLPDRINVLKGSMFGCDARGAVKITIRADDQADDAASNTYSTTAAPTSTPRPTGYLMWSHIAQMGGGFRMNFLGYEDIQP